MQIRPQVQNQKSEGGLFYLAWEDNLVSYAIQAKKKMRDWEGSNIEKLKSGISSLEIKMTDNIDLQLHET